MTDDRILSLVLTGCLDEAMLVAGMARLRALPGVRGARVVCADATRVSSVDPFVRRASCDYYAALQSYGVREIFCATPSAAVRMLGVAVGLATGMHFSSFVTLDEAEVAAKQAARARR
ncbi:MAG: hypothetical protein ABJE95_30075 [Byssovorax sp.]